MTAAPILSVQEVEVFLQAHHGAPIAHLEPLTGGFWSSAFAYRVGTQELVVRFGADRDAYEADRAATALNVSHLPVPSVVDIGDALGGVYAISARHFGRFLETVAPEEASTTGRSLLGLLEALFHAPAELSASIARASGPEGPDLSWSQWLAAGLAEGPRRPVPGWRTVFATDAKLDRLSSACERRVRDLLDACPERRDLIHGDLLHANVLVSADASEVTAVFSWKCAELGDFLFDTAWCSFCGATFHPGIAATNIFTRVLHSSLAAEEPSAFTDAAERHHCYELWTGATALRWNAYLGDSDAQTKIATHLERVLDRGPLRTDGQSS
ncbi:MAG: phosphotransferase family protein [Acidimicrobiales bacterium]